VALRSEMLCGLCGSHDGVAPHEGADSCESESQEIMRNSLSRYIPVNQVESKLVHPKYTALVESEWDKYSDDFEVLFGWIYKLQDRSCQDSLEANRLPFASWFRINSQNADDQILKLRKHLAELQMTTVSSKFIFCIEHVFRHSDMFYYI
jgi:hypothetical protein